MRTKFTGAKLALYATTNSYPGITNAEGSNFSVDLGARLSLPGLVELRRNGPGDVLLTADAGGVIDCPNVIRAVAQDFYQLELRAFTGGRIHLPSLATLAGGIGLSPQVRAAVAPAAEMIRALVHEANERWQAEGIGEAYAR